MRTIRGVALAIMVGGGSLALLTSCAQRSGNADRTAGDGGGGGTRGTHGTTVTTVADRPIPNIPGKRLVSLTVDYAPGGASASHRHAASGFIYAYVVSGAVRSQVNDEPVRVYKAGEHWFENPGSHHRVSENASRTEAARLLATFVVDADEKVLTTPDAP